MVKTEKPNKREHGLYKFVDKETGEILYIGKTNSSFNSRIMAHLSGEGCEEKFKEHVKRGCDIYTCELPNSTETDIMERAMINQYKPKLNRLDCYPGFSGAISVKEPEWKIWQRNTNKVTNRNIYDYSTPRYEIKDKEVIIAPSGKQEEYLAIYDDEEYFQTPEEAIVLLNSFINSIKYNKKTDDGKNFTIKIKTNKTFQRIHKEKLWVVSFRQRNREDKTFALVSSTEGKGDIAYQARIQTEPYFRLKKFLKTIPPEILDRSAKGTEFDFVLCNRRDLLY